MSQLTVDDLIEQAISKIIEERPQLGPFSSYLRNSTTADWMRGDWNPRKVAELDELELQEQQVAVQRKFMVEADDLERRLDREALVRVLTYGEDAPYPDAREITHILSRLDAEDVEPACKAFQERVAFHRMMRGEAQSSP
jgi:hypothetical protein